MDTDKRWARIGTVINVLSIYLFFAFFGGGIAVVINDPGLPAEWVYGPFNWIPVVPLLLFSALLSISSMILNYRNGRNFLGTVSLFTLFCFICLLGAGG